MLTVIYSRGTTCSSPECVHLGVIITVKTCRSIETIWGEVQHKTKKEKKEDDRCAKEKGHAILLTLHFVSFSE